MGASESTDRTPEWINGPNRSERTSNKSSEEDNASNGRGSTASKILTVAGAAIAIGGGLAYALSSSSASTSESPNPYSQPFSSSSSSSSGSFPSNHSGPKNISQNLSENNLIKCNVDGSFRYTDGSFLKGIAGCGGVFRDASGEWIHGFSHNLGVCEIKKPELWGTFVMKAELRGILTGLSIAWKKGFRNLIVESDSSASVKKIEDGCKVNCDFCDLIKEIQSLRELPWKVLKIVAVDEKANKAADWMADHCYKLEEGLKKEFSDPPVGIESVLANDQADQRLMRLGYYGH